MQPIAQVRISDRAAYSAPELMSLGSLESDTHGMSSGPKTDAFFPVGTPHSQVTFS